MECESLASSYIFSLLPDSCHLSSWQTKKTPARHPASLTFVPCLREAKMPEKMLLLLDQITLLHTIATHCCSIKLAIAKARQNAETLIKLHSICKKKAVVTVP